MVMVTWEVSNPIIPILTSFCGLLPAKTSIGLIEAKPAPAIARPDKNSRLSILFMVYYEKDYY
jgi:hypothetical protein